jgi:hypothetical protein
MRTESPCRMQMSGPRTLRPRPYRWLAPRRRQRGMLGAFPRADVVPPPANRTTGRPRPRSKFSLSGIVVIAALTLSGGAVFAAEDRGSANFVMPGCRGFLTALTDENTNGEPFLQGWCAGNVWGLNSMLESNCTPPAVTVGQLVRVVVRYIDARPARMHEDFQKLALEAMSAAWPCKR